MTVWTSVFWKIVMYMPKNWLEMVVKLQFSCLKFWRPPSMFCYDSPQHNPNDLRKGWRTLCFKEHSTQKEHFASQELNTLCFKEHLAKSQFTPQHTLLLNTLCYSKPFTPHCTLLLNTLCHSEPFTPRYTYTMFLKTLSFSTPGTICSSEHFAPQHPFLPGTLCSSTHYDPWNSFDHYVK